MATTTSVTINFENGTTKFARTFSGLNSTNINDKAMAKTRFIDKYKGIVNGTPVSYDFSVVEKDIEY